MGQNEDSKTNGHVDKSTLLAVLQVCRKFGLKDTEDMLKKEASLTEDELKILDITPSTENDTQINTVLSAYKSEGDPDIYDESYRKLTKFIDSSLDMYRHDLNNLVYPVFVHMYLELVYNGHEEQAINFMKKFGPEQEEWYQSDIKKLALVTKREQMKGNDIVESFRSPSSHSQFTLRVSRDAHSYLMRYLAENAPQTPQQTSNLQNVSNIIQEHVFIDIYDGLTRTKQQVDASIGGMLGEAARAANKTKVFYGLLKVLCENYATS